MCIRYCLSGIVYVMFEKRITHTSLNDDLSYFNNQIAKLKKYFSEEC